MTDSQILALVAYISAHSAILWKAMQWGFGRVLEYQILIKEFGSALVRIEKLERDVTEAHKKIRDIK